MPQPRVIDIVPPVGGVVRATGYQQMPPYTCYDALNVWPQGQLETRRRIGSRPGLRKGFSTQLGSGNPIRLLSSVRTLDSTRRQSWADDFSIPQLQSVWSSISGLSTIPNAATGYVYAGATEEAPAGFAHSDTHGLVHEWVGGTDWDTADDYTVAIDVTPSQSSTTKDNFFFYIFLLMDDTTPAPLTKGVMAVAESRKLANKYELNCYLYGVSGGTVSLLASDIIYPLRFGPIHGAFQAKVDGNDVSVLFKGTEHIAATNVAAYAAGTRFGFGLNPYSSDNNEQRSYGPIYGTGFSIDYRPFSTPTNKEYIIASSNGTPYQDDLDGGMSETTSSLVLSGNVEINAVEHAGVLYIADGELLAWGTDGTLAASEELSATSITSWSPLLSSSDYASCYCQLYDSAGTIVEGVYSITVSVPPATLQLPGAATGDGSGTSYRVFRFPKKIQTTGTFSMIEWAADNGGTIPYGCTLIARYNGRIILAGQPWAPHVWYQSKQNDPLDWDTSDTTDQGAIAGSSTLAGVIGQPITALVAYQDDYLIYFGERSAHIQRGDLRTGGTIDVLSQTIGCVRKSAWCFTPDGSLYWLSKDGLYMLPPGALGTPRPVSRQKLPEELLLIEDNETVLLGYDHYNRGIWIFITHEDNQKTHWWYDLVNGGFWPVRFPETLEPTSMYRQGNVIYFGCKDGYIRQLENTVSDDDGSYINSRLTIGPLRLAGHDHYDGLLQRLDATLSEDSDDLNWTVRAEDTSESSVKNENGWPINAEDGTELTDEGSTTLETESRTRAFGTWSSGKNYANRMRVRGVAASLNLSQSGTPSNGWAIEGVTMHSKPLTTARKSP